MPSPISTDTIQSLIIEIRGARVLLDSDVARVYAVQTRDVNKAVANNPDKFPEGYILRLQKQEKQELVENFHQFNKLKHSPVLPNAFSEKGLYMLATILKSAQATKATFAIIDHRRMSIEEYRCREDVVGPLAVGCLQQRFAQDKIDGASSNLFGFPCHFQDLWYRCFLRRINEQVQVAVGMCGATG